MNKEKKYLVPLILSFVNSLVLFGLCYFPVFKGVGLFSAFSIIFLSELVIELSLIITAFFKKDLHKIPNVLIIVYSGISALTLLLMTSWTRPEAFTIVDYIILLSTFGGGLVAKTVFMLIWHRIYFKTEDARFLGRRNFELISMAFSSYLILLLAVSIFDNPERNTFVYLGELIIEAGTTFIALFWSIYAFSPLPLSRKKSFIQNIKDLIKSLQEKNVFFYAGVIFTYVLGIIAFRGASDATGDAQKSYIALATFYFAMATIKLVTFWIHFHNKKKYAETNPKRYYKLEHLTMLLVAIILFVLTDTFAGALALIIANKEATETPIWWFIIYIVPFALFKFISAIGQKIKSIKLKDNPYLLIGATQSLITALYSVLGATALLHHLFDNDVTLIIHTVLQSSSLIIQLILVLEMAIKGILGLIGKRKQKTIIDPK